MSEAETRASSAEAELEELQAGAASSGDAIQQWQAAYADLQQQQDTAVAELQQLRDASGSSDSSIQEWRDAYADLQQQYSALQVCVLSILQKRICPGAGCAVAEQYCDVHSAKNNCLLVDSLLSEKALAPVWLLRIVLLSHCQKRSHMST